jgi:hypothetical protein
MAMPNPHGYAGQVCRRCRKRAGGAYAGAYIVSAAASKLVLVSPTPPELRQRYVEIQRASEDLIRRLNAYRELKPARHSEMAAWTRSSLSSRSWSASFGAGMRSVGTYGSFSTIRTYGLRAGRNARTRILARKARAARARRRAHRLSPRWLERSREFETSDFAEITPSLAVEAETHVVVGVCR